MRKNLGNSLALGFVVSVIALGGVSTLGAESFAPKRWRIPLGSEIVESESNDIRYDGVNLPEDGTGAFENPKGIAKFGMGIRRGVTDFSWAVEKGIISQETADKAAAYVTEVLSDIKSEMEANRELPPEERGERRTIENRKGENIFEKLVGAGIITHTEAQALEEAMPKPEFDVGDKEMRLSFGGLVLSDLVEKGIISQVESDSIKSYISQKMDETRTDMDSNRKEMKLKMEENVNIGEMNQKEFLRGMRSTIGVKSPTNLLDELVEKGIIDQDQADAIQELEQASNISVN